LQCRNMKYVFLCRVNRNNMKLRKYYPTIVLSDIHLFGTGISIIWIPVIGWKALRLLSKMNKVN